MASAAVLLALLALLAFVAASGSHAARVYVGGHLRRDDASKESALGFQDGDTGSPLAT